METTYLLNMQFCSTTCHTPFLLGPNILLSTVFRHSNNKPNFTKLVTRIELNWLRIEVRGSLSQSEIKTETSQGLRSPQSTV